MAQVNSFSSQHCPSEQLVSTERPFLYGFHTYLNICIIHSNTLLPDTGSVADNVLYF